MERASLGPRKSVIVPYTVPSSGSLVIKVTSNRPMNAYVVDVAGAEAYQGKASGRAFRPIASASGTDQVLTANMVPGTKLRLILENPSESEVSAGYDTVTFEDGYGGFFSRGIF